MGLKKIIFSFFILSSLCGFGQVENLIQNDIYQAEIEKQQAINKRNFHTAIRPYNYNEVKKLFKDANKKIGLIHQDSLINAGMDYIEVTPHIYSNVGLANSRITSLASDIFAGLSITASVKNKLAVNLSGYYGTQNSTGWESILRDSLSVFPNWGVARNGGIDRYFSSMEGYISFSPDHIFNMEVGRGRHFFGDGINSLFLSSNANAFPYFKLSTTVWNIKYVNLYGWHRDIRISPFDRNSWLNKFTASHFLSWNVSEEVSLSLFETIIWAAEDSLNQRGFDLNYLNPVIFYRPIEFSLGSADNAIIGFGLKWNASKTLAFYGQWMLDEFLLSNFVQGNGWWGNKFGFQAGVHAFDAFRIKDLNMKFEFNLVRPFTYSHGNVTQNYGHFNQSLAHPIGSNFYNFNLLANYRKKEWLFEGQAIYSIYGRDSMNTNLGGNIYQSYVNPDFTFGNEITQGVEHHLIDLRLRLNYMLSKRDDFRLFADLRYYNLNQLEVSNNLYFKIGLRINWADYR